EEGADAAKRHVRHNDPHRSRWRGADSKLIKALEAAHEVAGEIDSHDVHDTEPRLRKREGAGTLSGDDGEIDPAAERETPWPGFRFRRGRLCECGRRRQNE